MVLKSLSREFMRRLKFALVKLKRSPPSIIGLVIVIFYIVIALFAPVLAPPVFRDPFMIWKDGVQSDPRPPGSPVTSRAQAAIDKGYTTHIFGTTPGGGNVPGQYDIYYGCIWGTITAFRIGFLVFFGVLALGFVIGAIAGCFGGIIDELIMKFTDIILALSIIIVIAFSMALPPKVTIDIGFIALAFFIPIAIAIIAHFGFKFSSSWSVAAGLFSFVYLLLFPNVFNFSSFYSLTILLPLSRLDKVLIALILVGWPGYAKIIRGEILRVKHEKFARAAEAVGYSNIGVTIKRFIPDSVHAILITPFLGIGPIVLTAATLSFLNLGAPFGYADWGQMMTAAHITFNITMRSWYTFFIPGFFLFTFALGWILLGIAFKSVLIQSGENS